MGDFGTYKDIVFGNHRGRPLEISISIRPTLQKSGELLQKELWPSFSDNVYKLFLEYKYRTIRREIILREMNLTINDEPHIVMNYSFDSERHAIKQIGLKKLPSSIKSYYTKLIRMHNFLPFLPTHRFFLMRESSALSEFIKKSDMKKIESINTAVRAINKDLHNIDYIGAMRVSPQKLTFSREKNEGG